MTKREVGHCETAKTGIRDTNKKDAKEYFINTHSVGCQILDIETKYNY